MPRGCCLGQGTKVDLSHDVTIPLSQCLFHNAVTVSEKTENPSALISFVDCGFV